MAGPVETAESHKKLKPGQSVYPLALKEFLEIILSEKKNFTLNGE